MKFSDLPTPIQHFVFSFIDKDTLKSGTATVSREFANLTSQQLTKIWIESPYSEGWINLLGSKLTDLSLQYFNPPRAVIRTALRPPEEAMQGGFRRRGKKPQFLPYPFQTMNAYQKGLLEAKISNPKNFGDQFPWDTTVSTFDFSDYSNNQFEEAQQWGYTGDKRYDIKWVYFALAHLGVKANNQFKELALLGILPGDIIGAIRVDAGKKSDILSTIWWNPSCAAKQHYPELYANIEHFIQEKINEHKLVDYQIEDHATSGDYTAINKKLLEASSSSSLKKADSKKRAGEKSIKPPVSKKLKTDNTSNKQTIFALKPRVACLLGLRYAEKGEYEKALSFLEQTVDTEWGLEVDSIFKLIKQIQKFNEVKAIEPNKADAQAATVRNLRSLCKKLLLLEVENGDQSEDESESFTNSSESDGEDSSTDSSNDRDDDDGKEEFNEDYDADSADEDLFPPYYPK